MKKRISLILVMALGSLFSQAQQTVKNSGGTSFGLRAGVNFQNITGKDEDGNKLENDLLTGFNIGINAEIPLAPQFYFQPGLLFTTKGAKSEDLILGQTIKGKINISYVEMPLNFLYKPMLGQGRLLMGFGPYVALGVGGKATYEGGGSSLSEDIEFKKTVKLSDPDDVFYVRPMDAGANLLFGYQFANKVSVQLNAQLGLTKINPEYEGASNDRTEAKNTGFGISLGYRF
ncbi:MAG TPA: porin family protein [Chitinophagaceae bacterium]|nr:porin family protein [Chitinophagaceae bacterium]HQX71344.1 porin family protein [Chitinophagaceae bacterium]HQZ75288.1 porin family protein [Chitinophagaceae bacterium]